MLWFSIIISAILHLFALLFIKIDSRDDRILKQFTIADTTSEEIRVNLDLPERLNSRQEEKKAMSDKQRASKEEETVEAKSHKSEANYAYTEAIKGEGKVSTKKEKLPIERFKKEGLIPELILSFDNFDEYIKIAQFFGYKLVAYDKCEKKYICRIDLKNWSLHPITEGFMDGFSKRGRVVASDKLDEVAYAIFYKYGVPISDIVFFFLIPSNVENYFIEKEIEAGKKIGVEITQIEKVIGRYIKTGAGYSILIEELILKDGRRIQLSTTG